MKISDKALADYGDAINTLGTDQFIGFNDERDFIEQAIGVFDDVEGNGPNQTIRSISKKMDLSPIVEYFSVPKWGLETAELADFLFLVYHSENGDIIDRYTMISQAKYSDEVSSPSFDIKMSQYHLLNHLPVFKLDSPEHYYKHWLAPERNSFKNYVFAGECWAPFFELTGTLGDKMRYDFYDTDDPEYTPTKNPPVLNRMDTFLKRLIRGMVGERIEPGDDIYRLYEIMFEQSSAWPWSSSPNRVPDGGNPESPQIEEEGPGAGVIQIVVSDSESPEVENMLERDELMF